MSNTTMSNMFNLGEVQETTGFQPMKAGIRENIKLTSAVFEPLNENSDPVIQLTFEDEFGGQHRELLWEVDEERVKGWNTGDKTHSRDDQQYGFVKGTPITDEDAVLIAHLDFARRAKHIATKFASEKQIDNATREVNSYAEFGEAYVGLFSDEVRESVRVRLKVTLNSKDYTQLPKYPPFIESMEVPKEASRLEITQYDRVEKATVETADDPTDFNPATFDEDPGF